MKYYLLKNNRIYIGPRPSESMIFFQVSSLRNKERHETRFIFVRIVSREIQYRLKDNRSPPLPCYFFFLSLFLFLFLFYFSKWKSTTVIAIKPWTYVTFLQFIFLARLFQKKWKKPNEEMNKFDQHIHGTVKCIFDKV